MFKRTLTSAVYVAIITGFICLKEYVDDRLFSILIYFCSMIGTMELARALKDKIGIKSMWLSVVYGILFVPSYAVPEFFIQKGLGIYVALILALLCVLINVVFCFTEKVGVKNLLCKALPIIYPSFLFLTTIVVSMMGERSLIGLLLIFAISPLCDTFAYIVGMIYNKIKKGNAKKLCPRLSPKKTWAGAIGGTLGGIFGSFLVFVSFNHECLSLGLPVPFLIFVIIGFVGAVLTQLGDLFESAIKRSVGIKDIGKLIPYHGGILDRFDGTIFTSLLICVFLLIV